MKQIQVIHLVQNAKGSVDEFVVGRLVTIRFVLSGFHVYVDAPTLQLIDSYLVAVNA